MNKIPIYKDKFQWGGTEGFKNQNIKLVQGRHRLKYLMEELFGMNFVRYLKFLRSRSKLKKSIRSHNLSKRQLQKCGSLAIIFIGSGDYVKFFPRFYTSFKKYFLPETKKKFFIFTDRVDFDYFRNKEDIAVIPIESTGGSFMTLSKFKFIKNIKNKLEDYSHILFADSDMYASGCTSEEDFFCHDKPLFSVRHPCFLNIRGQFELNPKSSASLTEEDNLSTYRQACFWGGKKKELIEMCEEIEKNIEIDLKNKIIAIWLDESHLNKYFIKNIGKVHTHDSSYGYPGGWPILRGYKVKLVHDKGDILK